MKESPSFSDFIIPYLYENAISHQRKQLDNFRKIGYDENENNLGDIDYES